MTVFLPGSEKMLGDLPVICALHEGENITALSVLSSFDRPPFDPVKMTHNVINILNGTSPEELLKTQGLRVGWSRKDGAINIYVQENESLSSKQSVSFVPAHGLPDILREEIENRLIRPDCIKALCSNINLTQRHEKTRGMTPPAHKR